MGQTSVKTKGGVVKLNADEISELDRLTQPVGKIQEKIMTVSAGIRYQKLINRYRQLVKQGDGGGWDKNSEARLLLSKMHQLIDEAHREARSLAVNAMIASGDFKDLKNKADIATLTRNLNY